MAEKKTTKKTTGTKSVESKTTKKAATTKKTTASKAKKDDTELKKRVKELETQIENLRDSHVAALEELNNENALLRGQIESQPQVKLHYQYIARYDNIQLDGVVLNNMKSVIFECCADSDEVADKMFDAQIATMTNLSGDKLTEIKRKLFGNKVSVECYYTTNELSRHIEI